MDGIHYQIWNLLHVPAKSNMTNFQNEIDCCDRCFHCLYPPLIKHTKSGYEISCKYCANTIENEQLYKATIQWNLHQRKHKWKKHHQ